MTTLDERIRSRDIGLFAAIPSQTTDDDKRALLLLQDCVRDHGEYVYLEIGSHLGGTIQPYVVDPVCKLVYSIDKRPDFQPDERGRFFFYDDNSTERMLKNLAQAFPSDIKSKIATFDSDAGDLDPYSITEKPGLCFIDGEHTNKAVFSDFRFCLEVCHPDAVIAFHDTCYIYKGIEMIKAYLSENSIRFSGFMLCGSVYAILLNQAVSAYGEKITPYSKDELEYVRNAANQPGKRNLKEKIIGKYPGLYKFIRTSKKTLESLKNRSA